MSPDPYNTMTPNNQGDDPQVSILSLPENFEGHSISNKLLDTVLRECHPRTIQRARSIAQDETSITSRKYRKTDDDAILTGFVVSSSGWADTYRVSVTLQESSSQLIDYSCTCPASYQFEGPCKHCAALVLAFCKNPSSFEGFSKIRRNSTSPGLAEYLHRAKQAIVLESPGSIDFDTTLLHAYGQWSARFKIVGPNGSYVLKNLAEFLGHMRDGTYYSYGKKLAFSHVEEAFTSRGKAIIRFLEQADNTRRESHKAIWYANQSGRLRGRDISLSDDELVALVNILAKDDNPEVAVEANDALSRRKSLSRIKDDNPPLSLSVKRKARGFTITRSQFAQVLASDSRVIIWSDETFYRCTETYVAHIDILRTIFESNSESLFISNADMPLFCATALPALEQILTVDVGPEIESMRPIPGSLEFYLDKTAHFVTCEAIVVYGKHRYNLLDDSAHTRTQAAFPVVTQNAIAEDVLHSDTSASQNINTAVTLAPLRDVRIEARGRNLVGSYFSLESVDDSQGTHIYARIPSSGDDALANLLFGGLERLRKAGTVFTTPAFDRLITERKSRITLGVSLAGNLINLTISASDLASDELSALLKSYRRHRHYHRLKDGTFLDISEMNLAQLDHLVSDMDITSSQLASGHIELPSYRAFYLNEMLEDASRDESFCRYISHFDSACKDSHPLPVGLKAKLRPYQKEGFQWLSTLADMGFGGILADEMGLGKTLQIIAFLLARKEEAQQCKSSLIVCPASLVYNWTAEITRFAPDLKVHTVAGSKHERTLARKAKDVDIFITSYDLLRIDIEEWLPTTLFCCVADEAQYIKNHGTLTARAVKRLHVQHRFALTGTPMENRLSELWSIFDFVMPGFLGTYMRFKERFELDIIGGNSETSQRLASLIGPFMLRRLKSDVLTDLPDKIESIVPVMLNTKQRRLYDACEQQLREDLTAQRRDRKKNNQLPPNERKPSIEVLAELTRLRQICCDPRLVYENYTGEGTKLDIICELVKSASEGGQKVLVFSQFTRFIGLISQRLDRQEILYYTITGSTPKQRRVNLAQKFNEDDTPVFLISLKAGGTGLNLTGASVVIHTDPWWNSAAQNQATDRAHRIGQNHVVSVYRLITQDSVEERIVHLQDQKSELANTIVGAEGTSLTNLTMEDIFALLED